MKLKPIKTNREYEVMLEWVDSMFDKKIKANSTEVEKVQIALILIKSYEDAYYPIPYPNVLEAIKYKMAEKNI